MQALPAKILLYSQISKSGTKSGSYGHKKSSLPKQTAWCPGQESNLHALRHTHLKRARLPIPPPGHPRRPRFRSLSVQRYKENSKCKIQNSKFSKKPTFRTSHTPIRGNDNLALRDLRLFCVASFNFIAYFCSDEENFVHTLCATWRSRFAPCPEGRGWR